MASRLMHLAISREMLRQRRLRDFDRFFLGSILPDACGPGVKADQSHLKFRLKNRTFSRKPWRMNISDGRWNSVS